jgi:hypothetical protein
MKPTRADQLNQLDAAPQVFNLALVDARPEPPAEEAKLEPDDKTLDLFNQPKPKPKMPGCTLLFSGNVGEFYQKFGRP